MASEYRRVRLAPEDHRPEFDCDNDDLNEYYLEDSKIACEELVAVTYAIYKSDEIIAYYCVSNDAIRRDLTSNNRFKIIQRLIGTRDKRYPSLPAVKIGRFGVAKDHQSGGIGTAIMDGIKYDFINGNKTGCHFIIVDANNNPRTIQTVLFLSKRIFFPWNLRGMNICQKIHISDYHIF